jgi:hypothetical protein
MAYRESKRLKAAFHPNPLLPDMREEFEKVFGLLGIRVETDMKGFIPVKDRFLDRPDDLLYSSKGHFFSAGGCRLTGNISAAPGALNRTASAHGEMVYR